MCSKSLQQTAISLSSREAEFYAASACARELLGLPKLFKELHHKVSVRLGLDSDSASSLVVFVFVAVVEVVRDAFVCN